MIPATILHHETPTWTNDSSVDEITGVAYTSATHTLTHVLAGSPLATPVSLVATANGSGWTTTLDSTNSNLMTPATYWWQAILTASGFRKVLDSGQLTVLVDLAYAGASYDGRTDYEKALAQWKTALAAITSNPTKAYQIGTRSMTYRDLKEVQDMINWLTAKVITEKSQLNGGKDRNLLVRFDNAK